MIAAELEARDRERREKNREQAPSASVPAVAVPEEAPASATIPEDAGDIVEAVYAAPNADPRSEDAEPVSRPPPTAPDPMKKAQRDMILAAFLEDGKEPDSATHNAVTVPPPPDYKPTKL
jgi:hypothetical protein